MNTVNKKFVGFLEKKECLNLFKQTATESLSFWRLLRNKIENIKEDEAENILHIIKTGKGKINKTLLKVIARTNNPESIINQLNSALAENIENLFQNFPELMLGVLESTHIKDVIHIIRGHHTLFNVFNNIDPYMLRIFFNDLLTVPEHQCFMEKIAQHDNAKETLEVLQAIINSEKTATAFIQFLAKSKDNNIISACYENGLNLLKHMEVFLDCPEKIKKIYTTIFKGPMSKSLMRVLSSYAHESNGKILRDFLHSECVTKLISDFKTFEDQPRLLKSLLNLYGSYGIDTEKRIFEVLKHIKGKKIVDFIEETVDPDTFVKGIVWRREGQYKVAKKLIEIYEKNMLRSLFEALVAPIKDVGLVESIETVNTEVYYYIHDTNGHIYHELIQELHILSPFVRENLFRRHNIGIILSALQKLSSHPFLISALLKNEDYCEKIFDTQHLAESVDALANRDLTNKFVSFWSRNLTALNNLSFFHAKDGLLQSKAFIKGICCMDKDIPQTFITVCLKSGDISSLLESLLYKDINGDYCLASGFIFALEEMSTPENILSKLMLFKTDNHFKVITILEKINALDAENFFKGLLKKNTHEALLMMQHSLHDFIIEHAPRTRIAALLKVMCPIKNKNSALYETLIQLIASIREEDFYGVLQVHTGYDVQYKDVVGFIDEIHANKTFIPAIALAFGKDEYDLLVKFIFAIHDKRKVLRALCRLTPVAAKVFISAFLNRIKEKTIKMNALSCLNDIDAQEHCNSLVRHLVFDDMKNRKEPMTACQHIINFLNACSNSNTTKIYTSFGETDGGLLEDIERIFSNCSNKDLKNALLSSHVFISVLNGFPRLRRYQILSQILHDPLERIREFLEPESNVFVPLCVLFTNKLSFEDLVHIKKDISTTPEKSALLKQFVDVDEDPQSKFFTAILEELTKSIQNKALDVTLIDRFYRMFIKNLQLKSGFMRFACRDTITSDQVRKLISWLMTESRLYDKDIGPIMHDTFVIPIKRNTSVEDNIIYQWHLKACLLK